MSIPIMVWNDETKRLEFHNGEPVGARDLNAAIKARGGQTTQKHLRETRECAQRRDETVDAAQRFIRKALHLSKTTTDKIRHTSCRSPSRPVGGGYRAINTNILLPGDE